VSGSSEKNGVSRKGTVCFPWKRRGSEGLKKGERQHGIRVLTKNSSIDYLADFRERRLESDGQEEGTNCGQLSNCKTCTKTLAYAAKGEGDARVSKKDCAVVEGKVNHKRALQMRDLGGRV